MAKRKTAKKATPKSPPKSMEDAILQHAMDEITHRDISMFATYFLTDKTPTQRERKAMTRALIRFAALGWHCYGRIKRGEAFDE